MLIVGIIASNLAGYLVDHFGVRLPLLLATSVSSLGIISALFLFRTPSYFSLLPLLLCTGFGMTMVSGPVRVSILSRTRLEQHGMANSLLTGCRSIISVIVFALMGAVFFNLNRYFIAMGLHAKFPSLVPDVVQALQEGLSHQHQTADVLQQFPEAMQMSIQQVSATAYHHAFHHLLLIMLIAPLSALWLTLTKIKGEQENSFAKK